MQLMQNVFSHDSFEVLTTICKHEAGYLSFMPVATIINGHYNEARCPQVQHNNNFIYHDIISIDILIACISLFKFSLQHLPDT